MRESLTTAQGLLGLIRSWRRPMVKSIVIAAILFASLAPLAWGFWFWVFAVVIPKGFWSRVPAPEFVGMALLVVAVASTLAAYLYLLSRTLAKVLRMVENSELPRCIIASASITLGVAIVAMYLFIMTLRISW